jgi:hypothetical protein
MPLGIDGLLFDELTSDPGSPAEGQMWYNSTSKLYKIYRNGATTSFTDAVTFAAHAGSTANPHSTTLEQARQAGATLSGAINFGGYALTAVGAGSNGTDGAQRQWVLDQIKAYLAGLAWQPPVIQFQSSPPALPNSGDRYVVTATGTGDWTGKENQIAQWNGTSWDFTVPSEGYALRNLTTNNILMYDGSAWGNFGNAVDHNILLNLTVGDVHTQYQLRSEKNQNSGYCGLTAGGTIDDTRHGSRSGGSLHSVVSSGGAGFQAQSNRAATSNPGVSDDGVAGYLPGSHWLNTSNGTEWVCISNATGAAVWKETTNIAGVLPMKSGSVAAATFAGSPRTATVTFTSPFADANYSVQLTPVTSSKKAFAPFVDGAPVAGSFVICLGTGSITDLVRIDWHATKTGEST